MPHPSPPVYQDGLRTLSLTSLPAYTRRSRPSTARREPTEHVFDLRGSKHSIPWATLKICSCAHSPDQLPTFLEGDLIKGSLKLDLDHPDAIMSISVIVSAACLALGLAAAHIRLFCRLSS